MDVKLLKDEFHNSIVEALKKFSESAENQDVYAMVLDCDVSIPQIISSFSIVTTTSLMKSGTK